MPRERERESATLHPVVVCRCCFGFRFSSLRSRAGARKAKSALDLLLHPRPGVNWAKGSSCPGRESGAGGARQSSALTPPLRGAGFRPAGPGWPRVPGTLQGRRGTVCRAGEEPPGETRASVLQPQKGKPRATVAPSRGSEPVLAGPKALLPAPPSLRAFLPDLAIAAPCPPCLRGGSAVQALSHQGLPPTRAATASRARHPRLCRV